MDFNHKILDLFKTGKFDYIKQEGQIETIA